MFEAQLRDLAKYIEAHSKKHNAYKKHVSSKANITSIALK